jgi:hypothetical protein
MYIEELGKNMAGIKEGREEAWRGNDWEGRGEVPLLA